MIHAGTWADLTTDPLVAGDDGTSAYTDGSAYATIPADVPAYNLAAITISFYYQREFSLGQAHPAGRRRQSCAGRRLLASRCSRTAGCAPGTRARTAFCASSRARTASPAPTCRSARRIASISRWGRRERGSISTARSLRRRRFRRTPTAGTTAGSSISAAGPTASRPRRSACSIVCGSGIGSSPALRSPRSKPRSRSAYPTRARSRASPVSPARRLRYPPSPSGWSQTSLIRPSPSTSPIRTAATAAARAPRMPRRCRRR